MGIQEDDTNLEDLLMANIKNRMGDQLEQDKVDKDPLLLLGFGMKAYFKMVYCFMLTFLVLSLLTIPIFYIYVKWDGMNNTLPNYFLTKFTMGNMGFSAPTCRSIYADLDKNISFQYLYMV